MAFKKMEKSQYPPRLWALVGYPGSGKSTFAAQMQGPILVVDADHRFDEVLDLAAGDVYELSDSPADNVDADRIAAILAENMPGSGVETIVVDSLTAIIAPLVVQAMVDKDQGRANNLAAAFRIKALAMRQLQDAVTRWGTACLWIYHLNDARNAKGQKLRRATISQTELARLTRSINLQLEIVQRGNERGIEVVWARCGRSGMVLWDDSGTWQGMPDAIEEAVYGGLSKADQAEIERQAPEVFPNPETAIAWGLEQGAFEALQHARNAYEKLKREEKPKSAREMTALWVADVRGRLLEMNGDDEEDGDGDAPAVPEEPPPPSPAPDSGPGIQPDLEPKTDDPPSPSQPGSPANGGNGSGTPMITLPVVSPITPALVDWAKSLSSAPVVESGLPLGRFNDAYLARIWEWFERDAARIAEHHEIAEAVYVLLHRDEVVEKHWPAQVIAEIVRTGLARNTYQAIGRLDRATAISPNDADDLIVRWMRNYDEARTAGVNSDDAAAQADEVIRGAFEAERAPDEYPF